MWPFESRKERAVVVFHIDADGQARGAFFRGDADVLIVDDRVASRRAFQMSQQTPPDELRRKIGKHPMARLLRAERINPAGKQQPVLNLHWRTQPEAQA